MRGLAEDRYAGDLCTCDDLQLPERTVYAHADMAATYIRAEEEDPIAQGVREVEQLVVIA